MPKRQSRNESVNHVPGLFRKLGYRFVAFLLPLPLGED